MKTTSTVIGVLVGLTLCSQVSAQQPRTASLAEQKMCSEQARRAFNDSDAGKPINIAGMRRMSPAEYTNHFDANANLCYIMVRDLTVMTDKDDAKDRTLSTSIVVYDAFEGRVYASYLWLNRLKEGKKYWEVKPTDCSVKPKGQAELTCSSSEEFEALVDKNFGVAF